ncbi:hypothetical protein BS50DRAFT_482600 [Corynespora cassiicola Philippines]|uniref:PSP1 C-terminal domain-containing protein n=1 Tax=Corynespora cassiicola Philippines TaxID=1448308 RepID=A0A2T2P7Q5_CORCC|nr:hypothetical protein BS50DRAFT_482600 [Corynespora cassiicola Philippines]
MSSNSYKGGLSVSGPSFDKSKLQLRRPTPDSDVLASSDDDRDHGPTPSRPGPGGGYPGGRRPSSGWLQDIQPNRKFSLPSVSFAGSQPTTPSLELPQQSRPSTSAFPWNTSSFTSSQSGTRLKEVVPSPTTALPPTERSLPSPTNIEADEGIGFLLNQQNPVRKSVRSQSYSVGQADADSPSSQFNRLRTSVRHRPSKPSLLGESAVGLSQLREDDIDEVESSNGSEQGVRLPPGYWEREQKQALLKQAAVQNAGARNRATSSGSPASSARRKSTQAVRNLPRDADVAIDEADDEPYMNAYKQPLTRRFSEHVAGYSREPDVDHLVDGPRKPQWTTANMPAMSMENLGRRHSFATYTSHTPSFQMSSTLGNTQEEDEDIVSPLQPSRSPAENEQFDAAAYFAGYGPASRAINASAISAAHPDPIVPQTSTLSANPYAVPPVLGRPGRRLFVVAFKCSRAEIYYLYDNTGLEIRRGDLVIVEGDRGCDLGQVTHADCTLEDAKKYKNEANEEHFRWLVMFSQYSLAGASSDSGMLGSLARANGFPGTVNRAQITGMGAQQDQDAKPKMIKRLAQNHEIVGLRDKEGQEAKAKRVGAQKAAEHKLPMEILDAEYQADYHKLTYFYYAEAYVNFNDLVTDLFKQYKVRIWMSAVNPASVVNPAGLMQIPPPSAIGPGAIIHSNGPSNTLPVGPGFGNNASNNANNNNNYRQNDQYGRGRGNATQTNNYDESFYAFSHQIPGYPAQAGFQMAPWAHGQQLGQDVYGRYPSYPMHGGNFPNASTGGSPMNYGAYYPPTTYSASPAFNQASSGASYRGGYPATTGTQASAGNTYNNNNNVYGGANGGRQAPTSNPAGYSNNNNTGSYGEGAAPATSAAYDAGFLAAVQSLSVGK